MAGDPQATIAKMQQVRRAALAPAEPSAQDRRVAARASEQERRARAELERQRSEQGALTTPHGTALYGQRPLPESALIDVRA